MSRALRLVAAMVIACTGLVLSVSAPASAACTCKQGQLAQQVKKADVVFIGTVDAVGSEGQGHTYTVTASRAYQGTPERSTLVTSPGPDACGLGALKVGTTYVWLATGTASPYTADSCGGTGVANPTKVQKVETLLGEGTPVAPPPPPEAVLTKVEESAPPRFTRMAAPGAAAALIGLLGLVVVRRLARR
ncbi:hypothetical protein [Nocardioides okcheonensis]|uniref:hypothetical protein n=1 Tax=Nocardioides okcheonensis TaxID=2894081 RepID=UPI001E642B55|nr:hypothetical protein [Nocardioides okcheonensis]UFN43106.1 hypothetical protein LN652_13710 [Nocardioides okcheonensis]